MNQGNALQESKQNRQTGRGQKSGFTLAELLISLAILGVIATFTIPKILTTQQNGQRIAVFKETYATLSQVVYEGYQKGDVSTSTYATHILSNVNALRVCTSNSFTEGCWTQTDSSPFNERGQRGFILPNGATVAGFENGFNTDAFLVDWNGTIGPNIEGDDQIYLFLCSNSQGTGCGSVKPWTITPFTATSRTLYQNIFQ